MPGKTILVVDDETDLREAIAEALSDAEFSVIQAANGAEAVKTAIAEKPDLILMDVMMPIMDGHQALRQIRADAWGKTAKIIMLTALDDAMNVAKGVEGGSNDYIIKATATLDEIIVKVKQQIVGY